MNNILNPSRQALNTVQALGADFTLDNRIVKIGNTGNYSPDIDYLLAGPFRYQRSQVFEPERYEVTVTYAAGVDMSFTLTQTPDIGGPNGVQSQLISYEPATTDSLANSLAKLKAIVDELVSSSQFVDVTCTVASPKLIISGPNIKVAQSEQTAVAKVNRTVALNATPGTAIAGTTTVTITTAAAHNLATGNLANIVDATGSTFTNVDTGEVSSGEIEATITVVTPTTFTLRGVTKSGTNTGAATLSIVPTQAIGQGATLVTERDFVSDDNLPLSGSTYVTLGIEYGNSVTALNTINRNQEARHIVYLNEASANIESALTKIREIRNNYVSGGTDANPESAAVGA